MVAGGVVAYRTMVPTGLREWPFFFGFIVLTPFAMAVLVRISGQLFPLPLRVPPKPFEHANIYADEKPDPKQERLKCLADSIDPKQDKKGAGNVT
jgi:hypothetical protein